MTTTAPQIRQRAKTRAILAASLILDYSLYPRHTIDDSNVARLRKALRAGVALPPVVADRASLRVIDGFHRVTATLSEGGDDAMIGVELIDIGDENAMLLEAMARNASHGLGLSSYDRTRCILLAEERAISPDDIAAALSMTVTDVAKIRQVKTAFDPDGDILPVKRQARHLAGTTMTAKQVDAHRRAPAGTRSPSTPSRSSEPSKVICSTTPTSRCVTPSSVSPLSSGHTGTGRENRLDHPPPHPRRPLVRRRRLLRCRLPPGRHMTRPALCSCGCGQRDATRTRFDGCTVGFTLGAIAGALTLRRWLR